MIFSLYNKRSLQDTLILFGSGMTLLIILPFMLYRLINGDYYLGTLDLIISGALIALFIQAWYSIQIENLNIIITVFFMSAALGVINLKISEMIFWAYPAIIATFFLLKSHYAGLINSVFIGAVISISFAYGPYPISLYTSLLLVGIFGFIISIRSEQQTKKLRQLISEDSLTRINNRRSFDEKTEEMLALNKRSSTPVCLLLLDLDSFKKVNDTYGHKQGDKLLINFAQTVKSLIRQTDYVYRFGGEEFVVIATNSTLENMGTFANNIREVIQNTPSLSEFNVTVSIGVSEIHQTDNADSWFRRADMALYESKSKGRNRVCLTELDEKGLERFKIVKKNKNLKVSPPPSINHQKDEYLGESSNFVSDNDIHQKPNFTQ